MRFALYSLAIVQLFLTPSFLSAEPTASPVIVQVQLDDQWLQFTERPRLLDVLQYAAIDSTTYWPAASLHQSDDDMQAKHAQFLQQLLQLRDDYRAKNQQQKANAIQLLYIQVRQWQLARRVPLSIDLDKARTQLAANPRLDSGDYRLTIGPRPKVIYPVGLYQESAPMPHQRATPAREYLVPGYRLPLADRNYVLVVQPDGTVTQVGVAYWNRHYHELQPGAQLLIPFAPRALPRRYRHLNNDLIELALHRVVVE